MSIKNQHVTFALQKIPFVLEKTQSARNKDLKNLNPTIETSSCMPQLLTHLNFLSHKTQFKAHDILIFHLNQNKIYFPPSLTFAA